MKSKRWVELLEENYNAIINKGVELYKESIENRHLYYNVEMDKEGNISTWYSGSNNTIHLSVHKGDSIVCLCIDNNDLEINISDTAIESCLIRQNKAEYLKTLELEQSEDYTSYECLIAGHHPELRGILEQCIEDEKQFLCDSCREMLEDELDEVIRTYRCFAEMAEAQEE